MTEAREACTQGKDEQIKEDAAATGTEEEPNNRTGRKRRRMQMQMSSRVEIEINRDKVGSAGHVTAKMRTSNKDDDDKQGGLLIPGYHYISPSNSADRIPSPERAAFYRAFGWGMEWISGGWMKSLWTKGLETQTTLISPGI
ncbi:hypothetical protein PABG_11856 [Paracoccidioides brasiliensis Pb03]|nr:hypothetical protein PABG_11856 [Paracoccidioides brasiliensis Pb03]